MKKKVFYAIILLINILILINICSIVYAKDNHDVISINFEIKSGQGHPQYVNDIYERFNFRFNTSNYNEIEYIMHYLNAFSLKDKEKHFSGGDMRVVNTSRNNKDSTNKVGFVGKYFYDIDGKQYSIDMKEYDRFIDFVYALKTEKLKISNGVLTEPSKWAETDILKAIESDLVPKWNQIGYKNYITRLEVCQLADNLLKIEKKDAKSSGENLFNDTNDVAVTGLYKKGIVNGKTETEFCPYDNITREEFAKILSSTYDVLDLPKADGKYIYADDDDISDWAKSGVNKMYYVGLMHGKEDNMFKPKDNITKEEVIISLFRLSQLVSK